MPDTFTLTKREIENAIACPRLVPLEERERIVSDLPADCRQDSLALFEIYAALCEGDR